MISWVRNIDVLRAGLVLAVLYALVGVIVAIFWGLVGANMTSMMYARGPAMGLGWAAVVVFPFAYAVGGFIAGVVGAALYNLVSAWTGAFG